MSIRILVANNRGILRQGIASLIVKQSDMEVVGEADNGLHAVELAHQLWPDVVLMDVSMPVLNGIEATHAKLRQNCWRPRSWLYQCMPKESLCWIW